MCTSVLRKKLPARGRLGRSAAPNFHFETPPYLRNEWSSEVEIWYTGRHLQVPWLHVTRGQSNLTKSASRGPLPG